MFQYVFSRLLWLIPTILAMALVTFLVMHATPGSPLDPVAEGANPLSPEGQKALAKFYGLDKPLYEQFWIFVTKAVHGDFGYSFVYKTRTAHWRRWGPYLADRQWGTVREDYSPHGTAWDFFPHDHARSRVYR